MVLSANLAPVGFARDRANHAHGAPSQWFAEDERLVRVAAKTEAEWFPVHVTSDW